MTTRTSLALAFAAALGLGGVPAAQAQNLTSLVNMFIGTATGANGGSGGNNFPGAAVPHAMVKAGIDVNEVPRQAGYIHDNSSVTGLSLMHDEGTGGTTTGGYGFFPLFPLSASACPTGFTSCPVTLDARQALRAANADQARPGYFTTAFTNGIKLEVTSTRRAGLIRFTYPTSAPGDALVVVDLTDDLQRSFSGGNLTLDGETGRILLDGTFLQSYGPSNYTVHACYDFLPAANASTSSVNQTITTFGTYDNTSSSETTITPNATTLAYAYTSSPQSTLQAGALLAFAPNTAGQVTARFGVSFINAEQACANAEAEIAEWDFEGVSEASAGEWEGTLERIKVDTAVEDPTVVELLYSSLYRSALVPANLTGENPYWESQYPFFDAMFCSWDVFRTVHPLLSLTSPREWADIVNAYVDGWRGAGYIPECRSNTKPGYVQGGSDGMPILGDFAAKYGANPAWAAALGVPTDDLYQALVDTAENTPPDWYTVGRQNTAWIEFGYIPTDWTDPSGATGLPTREASRTLEYAVGDFAVRQAALALNKSQADVWKYGNRSMGFLKVFDPNTTSDGYSGFSQQRYANGTFIYTNPIFCSPVDPIGHSCARGTDNNIGFYESSSWEMSFFAPHSMADLVELMGGSDTFVNRTNHYYSAGYFTAGNEPGFAVAWQYHYANRPEQSALRVRNVVYENFNTGIGGIPGNDDSGAMASLLIFHLLGLYPVPASRQLLIGSPFLSSYTLTNDLLNTSTTVRVSNFDNTTLSATPPAGSRLFVQNITVNGVKRESICWIDWTDLVGGGEIVIDVYGDEDAAVAAGCGSGPGALPDSLSTGGFGSF